jgi:large subunit ribosomal protein L6
MSRVAKAPIVLPSAVDIKITSQHVEVKGSKGTLQININDKVNVKKEEEDGATILKFNPKNSDKEGWAQAGTARSLINNMVSGVTKGFEKTLELVGVGYRAQAKGTTLVLSLGFSHPVEYSLPGGVTAELPNNSTIILRSIDKQLLGQVAAEIRAYREPEPYKGKGIRYSGEVIRRKEAKKK